MSKRKKQEVYTPKDPPSRRAAIMLANAGGDVSRAMSEAAAHADRLALVCLHAPASLDIDDLRTLCHHRALEVELQTSGNPLEETDDELAISFYAWQEANMQADTWMDDSDGMAELLAQWFEKGMPAATISDVTQWLKEWFGPDEIGETAATLVDMIHEWRS